MSDQESEDDFSLSINGLQGHWILPGLGKIKVEGAKATFLEIGESGLVCTLKEKKTESGSIAVFLYEPLSLPIDDTPALEKVGTQIQSWMR